MSRKLTIFNTIGNNKQVINTNATTWEGLQNELSQNGVNYSGMRAVVGESQVTLESSQAILPQEDFTLFLMPQKVKSGGGDDYLLDWEDGITWDEEDWTTDNVEEYCFKTAKDLAIARIKRASFYLDKVVEYLIQSDKASSSDPQISNLAAAADQIKRNMDLFD